MIADSPWLWLDRQRLLVAKVHKIVDRVAAPDRLRDKHALDVDRLVRAVPTEELVRRFRVLLEIEEHGGWPGAFQAGKEARREPPLRKVAEERRPPYEPGDK